MIQDGKIITIPSLIRVDLWRASELFGSLKEYIQVKMTSRKESRVIIDNDLVLDEKKQMLYIYECNTYDHLEEINRLRWAFVREFKWNTLDVEKSIPI